MLLQTKPALTLCQDVPESLRNAEVDFSDCTFTKNRVCVVSDACGIYALQTFVARYIPYEDSVERAYLGQAPDNYSPFSSQLRHHPSQKPEIEAWQRLMGLYDGRSLRLLNHDGTPLPWRRRYQVVKAGPGTAATPEQSERYYETGEEIVYHLVYRDQDNVTWRFFMQDGAIFMEQPLTPGEENWLRLHEYLFNYYEWPAIKQAPVVPTRPAATGHSIGWQAEEET